MRRRSLSVDNDSLSVMVPRSDKELAPMSAARLRRLHEHLVKTLREARGLKSKATAYPPQPAGFAARVARAACGLCKGWCCRNGNDDAFLDDQTMARVRRDRPELDTSALIRLYSDRVPAVAYNDSCIFHGSKGCTLDRSMRADICNSYFCGGLTTYLRDRQQEAPTVIIAGKGGGIRTSPVLTP
jgi:hypothetical protein